MKPTDLLLFLVFSLLSCSPSGSNSKVVALPYYAEATFTPIWLENKNISIKEMHTVSPFALTNQEGRTITEQDLRGKIYVTDFFFTACPGICPKMMTNMMDLQNHFRNVEDVTLLSHSVTPSRDSVPVLKAYAESRGIISNKWHLVTGNREEIYRLGREEYFVEEDLGLEKDPDEFLHTENFVLVDKAGHIRGIYNGLSKNAVGKLIQDIELLRKA